MQWSQPPLPPDDRIKRAVRRGEAFPDSYDAARAVAYAEGFLKNAHDLTQPPVFVAIVAGLLVTIVLQVTLGYWFVLIVPVGLFLGAIGYIAWLSVNRPRVEQALAANRRVLGG
jgi:hypothetical protein